MCNEVVSRHCEASWFITSLRGFVEAVAIFYFETIYEKVCDHHNDADDGSVSIRQGFLGGDVLECGEFL